MDNMDRGLGMVPIDLKIAKIIVFNDGSFDNNKDLSSQIGFVIILVNEDASHNELTITGSFLHLTSIKCERITRSVLASKIYRIMIGFDMGLSIATNPRMITERLGLPLILLIICAGNYHRWSGQPSRRHNQGDTESSAHSLPQHHGPDRVSTMEDVIQGTKYLHLQGGCCL